jgi:hypothetical protein
MAKIGCFHEACFITKKKAANVKKRLTKVAARPHQARQRGKNRVLRKI